MRNFRKLDKAKKVTRGEINTHIYVSKVCDEGILCLFPGD